MANPPSLGTNLSAGASWSTIFPYVDLMHQATGFLSQGTSWDSGVTLDLDSSGWVKSLPAGTWAGVYPLLDNPAGPDTAGDHYIVMYDGDGTFQGALGATISEASPGRFVLTSGSDGQIGFQITSTNPTDYVRDIHVVREDQLAYFDAGIAWNPQFLEKVQDFHTFRFMDMMNTNAVYDANGVVPWPDSINAANIEWADRPLMTDAQWNNGVPVEAMVELCNSVGADGWFNMPVNASDDYVRQFATYVRDHLNPGLQVHVEFSNEVWNWAFPQAQYANAHYAGFANWMEWYGVRTAQVGRIWNEVFGESPTGGEDVTGRVHVVYNTQAAYQGLESYGLETANWYENGVHVRASDYFDEYAITGYYAFNNTDLKADRSWWSNPDGGFDAALASLQQYVDGPLKAIYAYHAGQAAERGLELTTYESGYGAASPDETADYQQFLIDVQRQPGLYDIEKANYQNFKDAGGDLYMNFGIIGQPSRWGSWAALESVYQETSPRYQALTDWNATVAPWYETGRDPSVFDLTWMLSQNGAPTITSNGGGDTATASVAENSTAVTTVTATDPDIGQTLSYSIIGGPDAGKFKIDASTGALSFVTAPNFELPTDAGGNNVYDVIVQASDGHGGSVTQAIAGTVTDVNEGTVIISNGGGNATASIAENTTSVTTVTATDPAVGQTLSYSISGGADASKFTIGATSGALSFVTAPNFELPTDAGGKNIYDVTVQASDGHGRIATQAIAVTVTDVNEAPLITSNGANTAAVSIAENTTQVTTVTATDPDVGQTLDYSIIGGADASKFTIGASTGALSFVTAPNLELPTDAGGNNVYDVIVQASDGHGGIVTQAVAVAVTDVNEAPVITSNGGGDTTTASIAENTTAVTTVTATDPDIGQTLSYLIIGGADASKFTIGASTGALSFVTAPNFELPTDMDGNNVYDVTVQVSDGHGGIDSQAIAVSVQNVGAIIHGTAGNDVIDMTHTVAGQPLSTTEEDIINGGGGGDALIGGPGADTFVFDLTALTPAQPGSGIVDHILDYNQGNSGTYNSVEGDTFDFSALLSAVSGQPVANLVRVTENLSGTAAILQINQDGKANGAHWTTIAQLDGVHTGDAVRVILDPSQPAAMLDVTGPNLVDIRPPPRGFFGGPTGAAETASNLSGGAAPAWVDEGHGFIIHA